MLPPEPSGKDRSLSNKGERKVISYSLVKPSAWREDKDGEWRHFYGKPTTRTRRQRGTRSYLIRKKWSPSGEAGLGESVKTGKGVFIVLV